MKKNVKNRLFEQQYNNVMKRLGTAVRRILESEVCDIDEDDEEVDECGGKKAKFMDEDDLEECNESYNRISRMRRLDEMARAAVNRTVNPKSYANVRDAIARRNYDEDWASSVRPLSKFDAVELLHRYVSALLIFGKECPQTEDDIDKIGVFAEYAHKLIDEMGGTLDDIKTLYEKNDKVQSRKRVGITRGLKGGTKATKNEPAEDFNFDEPDEQETPEVEDVPATPSYDEVEDVPANDEIEDIAVDDDEDDEFNIPSYDSVGDDEDDDVYEIENISELTLDQFYDSSMNASFANFNDDYILRDGKKIGFAVKINEDGEESNEREITIFRDSFGKALEDFDVILQASINNLSDRFYEFRISDVVKKFFKAFRNVTTDEMADEFDERADDFYYKCFANAESVDDVVEEIEKMEK